MSAADIGLAASTAVTGLVLGSGITMLRMQVVPRPGKCPSCGHGTGCVDRYTGRCTGQDRMKNYVSGARRGWKYAACQCLEHGPRTEQRAITT